MLQPSINMNALGVVVRPVDHTALGIPFVLAIELNCRALPKIRDTRCQIDIMSDQQGLSVSQSNDEPLMPIPIHIIGQHADDDSLPLNLKVAYLTLKRGSNDSIGVAI